VKTKVFEREAEASTIIASVEGKCITITIPHNTACLEKR